MTAPTEKNIRRLVGERSFARGERYYQNGHVHAAHRQGKLLRARCYGSDDNDYRLEVRLSGSRIVSGRCSCPVGEGGLCKHVAALLLNWRDRPDEFRKSTDIDTLLATRSTAELTDIIQILLDAAPDLEEILEATLTTGAQSEPELMDYAQQTVAEALRRLVGGARTKPGGGNDPRSANAGAAPRAAGETTAAIAIVRGIFAAVQEGYDINADATADVARAVGEAAAELTRWFAELSNDDELRGKVFRELLALLWFDVCHAGAGLAESVPDAIKKHATANEKRSILAWVREYVPSRSGSVSDAWQRECWGALIADVVGDELSDKDYSELCRELGLAARQPEVRTKPAKSRAARIAEPRAARTRKKPV